MSSNPHFIRLRIQATLREGFGDRLTPAQARPPPQAPARHAPAAAAAAALAAVALFWARLYGLRGVRTHCRAMDARR